MRGLNRPNCHSLMLSFFYSLTQSEPHPRPPPHAPTLFKQSFCEIPVTNKWFVGTVNCRRGSPHFQTDRLSPRVGGKVGEFVFELV
jgi:hypothetical protein